MTKVEAIRQLNIGYALAAIGFVFGAIATNEIKQNFLFSGLIMSYAFWGIYWGFRIVNQPIKNFFAGVFIMETSIPKLIWNHLIYKLTMFAITFIIAYFIGLLGGGIYKQITLMQVK
jgi:hypothetical protein